MQPALIHMCEETSKIETEIDNITKYKWRSCVEVIMIMRPLTQP